MHEFISKNKWGVLVVGLLLLIVGISQTAGQAANGTGKQMLFDTLAIIGTILTLSGIVLVSRNRKPKA